jgi:serine phosphatase RsbU (regulator of sigma subunit)
MTTNIRIQNIPVFASLPPDAIRYLELKQLQTEIAAGTLIFREGDTGDSFYVILEGEVDVIKAMGTDDQRHLAFRGPGSFIGEMGLVIRDGRRTASVIARTPITALKFTHQDFDELLRLWPDVAVELLREVSIRLRETDDATIRDLQKKNIELAKAYHDLQQAQEQIIQKQILERELLMARRIQMSILPNVLPRPDGFEFGACIQPARAVGGDFYDVIRFDRSNYGIVIGDISDKGVPAAIFMALTRSLVRAKAAPTLLADQVLQRVNHLLLEMNSEGMFASVIYGILNTQQKKFTYARAGHESPLLISATGTGQYLPLGSGQLLGIFPQPEFDLHSIELPEGSKLLLYTDGVLDATSDSGEMFGPSRFSECISSMLGTSAQGLCERLISVIEEFQGDAPQADDITLFVINAL